MEEETLPEGWMTSHQEMMRVEEGGGEVEVGDGAGEGVGGAPLQARELQWNPTLPKGWMYKTKEGHSETEPLRQGWRATSLPYHSQEEEGMEDNSLPEGWRLRPAPERKFQMDLITAHTSLSQESVICANTC